MPSGIYVNGRTTVVPGSYSEVDVSGLAVVGLGAIGIVACLGEAEGGEPNKVISISNPGKVGRTFRSGDLREAGAMLFSPSKDPNIPGGAAKVLFVKVNPATQSSYTFDNLDGPAMTLTSKDWGLFTTRINVEIADGTLSGKAVTINMDDATEEFDNIGGDNVFTLLYTPGTYGADTMTAELDNSTGVRAYFTKAESGLSTDITAPAPGTEAVQVSSSSGLDVTQTVTVYGTSTGGVAQTETLALNGLTAVVGTKTWGIVYGVILSAACVGTVSLKSNPTVATTILTVAPAALTKGVVLCERMAVSTSPLTVVADGATTKSIGFFGYNGNTAIGEALTLNGTTPVGGVTSFTELTVIGLGHVEAARTATVSGKAFALPPSLFPTVNDVYGWVAALDGWTMARSADSGDLPIAELDENALSTVIGSAKEFFGTLAYLVAAINAGSALVTATRESGATGAPSNTTAPVFLTGGSEGATSFSDWQNALDLLKEELVNTVVPLTDDSSVHAAVEEHCRWMCGNGRMERDAVLGAPSGTDLTTAKALARALNSRHTRLCIQDVSRVNVAGQKEQFAPYFTACLAAGMQAGAPIGEALTFKYLDVLDVIGDSSYRVSEDGDELIDSGLFVIERNPGIGFRWLRNVTTYLIDDNFAFVEASVNQAANFAAYTFRTALEIAVGRKGFAGTVNAVKSEALKVLGLMVDEEIVTNWRNLTIELEADVMTVDVEIAPVLPTNFVKTTLHLVTTSFSATV